MLVRGVAWRKQVEWRSALCSLSGRAALSYSPRALVRPSVPGSLFFFLYRCGLFVVAFGESSGTAKRIHRWKALGVRIRSVQISFWQVRGTLLRT